LGSARFHLPLTLKTREGRISLGEGSRLQGIVVNPSLLGVELATPKLTITVPSFKAGPIGHSASVTWDGSRQRRACVRWRAWNQLCSARASAIFVLCCGGKERNKKGCGTI
jgi:hypothetical protein